MTDVDPVLAKRESIRKKVSLFKKIGYGLMLISIAAFFACIAIGWPLWLTWVAIASFTASCIILPLPIIFGYAITAAEKEDRKMGL